MVGGDEIVRTAGGGHLSVRNGQRSLSTSRFLCMGLIATLRKKWRQHDEKLAAHAHTTDASTFSPSGSPLLGDGLGERVVLDGNSAESAREHDEPQ